MIIDSIDTKEATPEGWQGSDMESAEKMLFGRGQLSGRNEAGYFVHRISSK
jgi:hypothetical protein